MCILMMSTFMSAYSFAQSRASSAVLRFRRLCAATSTRARSSAALPGARLVMQLQRFANDVEADAEHLHGRDAVIRVDPAADPRSLSRAGRFDMSALRCPCALTRPGTIVLPAMSTRVAPAGIVTAARPTAWMRPSEMTIVALERCGASTVDDAGPVSASATAGACACEDWNDRAAHTSTCQGELPRHALRCESC